MRGTNFGRRNFQEAGRRYSRHFEGSAISRKAITARDVMHFQTLQIAASPSWAGSPTRCAISAARIASTCTGHTSVRFASLRTAAGNPRRELFSQHRGPRPACVCDRQEPGRAGRRRGNPAGDADHRADVGVVVYAARGRQARACREFHRDFDDYRFIKLFWRGSILHQSDLSAAMTPNPRPAGHSPAASALRTALRVPPVAMLVLLA